MKIIPFTYDTYDDLISNTYLVIDNKNRCVVIDPGCAYQGVVNYVKKNNLTPKAILLTHGHFDHMRGVDNLYASFKMPVYIGFDDCDKLKDKYLNCSYLLGQSLSVNAPVDTLADKQILKVLSEDILVIHTPYHTSGSLCFYFKDSGLLFTGDFILPHGVGRSDLPSAKPHELNRSMAKIFALPKETKIYAGHGPFSTIETELRVNPFVK